MKTLLFIVNPRAGRTRSMAPMFDVVARFSQAGYLIKLFITEGPGDAKRAAAELGGQFDLVVCAGGDGTLNETLCGLMTLPQRPPVGYIPHGSTNDFAASLRIPAQPMAAANAIAACTQLSATKTGALIVFERSVTLDEQMRSGTIINSDVTAELLKNIFYPKAPLHDGAVVIRDGRIAAAGCVLPLTSNTNLSPDLGTRHRAGIGMSEHSDAVIVIVSEETGGISIAVDGMLKRRLSPDTFEAILRSELVPAEEQQRRRWDIIVDFVKKLNPLRREKQHDKKDDDQQNSQQ